MRRRIRTTAGLLALVATSTHASSLIHLNAGTIDTRHATQPSAPTSAARTDPNSLHLIQWDGPIQPEWIDTLTATGARIIDYIPDNAYLVYAGAGSLRAVRALSTTHARVRWQAPLRATDKVHPMARIAAPLHLADTSEPPLYALQLVEDPPANAITLGLVDALKRAPIHKIRAHRHYINLVVALPPDTLDDLADQPDVISINPYTRPVPSDERQAQIIAGNTSGGEPSGPGYLAWLNSQGFSQEQFTASGFVVNISDSGVENGTTNVNHPGLRTLGTTSGATRVVYNRLEGTGNPGGTLQGCDGHGTINAHILAGYNDRSGFPHTDSAGYRYGLGLAPFVKVGASVIFDPFSFTFPDYSDLIARAYRDGARISSDSWGAPNFGIYDIDAQEYDSLVRDAQPAGSAIATPGNQSMTIVFAAGNDGPGAQTIGSPGTAKNVITIGASENVRSLAATNGGNNAAGNDGCLTSDSGADHFNDIAGFSSRGPTADSRKKPELVAPGTHITGGIAQSASNPDGLGSNLPCFTASGICALEGGRTLGNTNNFFPLGQRWYSVSSGTSHSTPAAAGAAALVRQHAINRGRPAPSPALTKAWLVVGARYLTGTSANDTLWSNHQGMGGLDLSTAFDDTPRLVRDQEPADTFTASGQSRSFTAVIASNDLPLRVTLTWTDAPGSTIGASFKNDLNLVVIHDNVLYRGNVFSGPYSTPGGSADPRNNTESVFLPVGATGIVSIIVSAFNINSDGVPNEGGALDQDFALIAYNAIPLESPQIRGAGAALLDEDCPPGNNDIDPGEYVTVSLALTNAGVVAASNLTATLLGIGGVTIPGEPVFIGALAPDDPPVPVTFSFTAAGSCGGHLAVTLDLTEGGQSLGTVTFPFTLGAVSQSSGSRTNATTLPIPEFGPASPYPSTNTVSGFTGVIETITVTLHGFAHSYPEDLDVLLVGPSGASVVLMTGAGGNFPVTNATLTFDDASGVFLPNGSPISSGTFKPTRYFLELEFEPPAPGSPYGFTLSEFVGSSPNGDWLLYLYDVSDQDGGTLAGGWQLDINAVIPACCEAEDSDLDGMPDPWEMRQFGDLTTAGPGSDSDGDYVSDLDEFLAGTQPTNQASLLQILDHRNTGSGDVVVTWPGIAGKTYSLAASTNLVATPFLSIATNIPGIQPANVHTLSAPASAETSFRVLVSPP